MPLALLLLATCLSAPPPLLHLTFDPPLPYIADAGPSHLNGLLHAASQQIVPGPHPGMKALLLDGKADYVELPGGRTLLGDKPATGTLALWVRPDFDPAALPPGTWDGWVVIAYIQHHSQNGLPDGANEIGFSLHANTLFAKVDGGTQFGPFPVIPSPLKQGQWTHLALTWSPDAIRLYVDGKPAAQVTGAFQAPELDDSPALLGCHLNTHKWFFGGAIADFRLYTTALSPSEVAELL